MKIIKENEKLFIVDCEGAKSIDINPSHKIINEVKFINAENVKSLQIESLNVKMADLSFMDKLCYVNIFRTKIKSLFLFHCQPIIDCQKNVVVRLCQF